jgi:hypothetical protein
MYGRLVIKRDEKKMMKEKKKRKIKKQRKENMHG